MKRILIAVLLLLQFNAVVRAEDGAVSAESSSEQLEAKLSAVKADIVQMEAQKKQALENIEAHYISEKTDCTYDFKAKEDELKAKEKELLDALAKLKKPNT